MIAPDTGQQGQRQTALPTAAGGSVSGLRLLMGLLLFLIAAGAIVGVVVSLSSGQPTVALIIGLVAAAFFARVGC